MSPWVLISVQKVLKDGYSRGLFIKLCGTLFLNAVVRGKC